MNIFLLILIGISLSMDTFSLSVSIGSFNISSKRIMIFSFLVGIFHFIMPILGYYLGSILSKLFIISSGKTLTVIFTFILFEMIMDLFQKNDKKFKLSLFSMIIYAFSVSIDAFTVGIGLTSIVLAPFIFAIISFLFTYLGLKLGKYSYSKIGVVAKIIGILIVLSLVLLSLKTDII